MQRHSARQVNRRRSGNPQCSRSEAIHTNRAQQTGGTAFHFAALIIFRQCTKPTAVHSPTRLDNWAAEAMHGRRDQYLMGGSTF